MKMRISILLLVLLLAGCSDDSARQRMPQAATRPGGAEAVVEEEQSESVSSEVSLTGDPWVDPQVHGLENRDEVLEGDLIEIRERMFVEQVNDVYLNPGDYLNKLIKYQGFYYIHEEFGEEFHYIARNGPGCCANDTLVGFEVPLDDRLPEEDDWVEVVGKVQLLEDEGLLVFQIRDITVLEERGQDTVS